MTGRSGFRTLVALTILFIGFQVSARAQTGRDPGQEDRPIKALSDEEILSYLNGEGMGYAKAAELNRYPDPRRVLELAPQLRLTEPQKQRVTGIYDQMHQRAAELGRQIVSREAVLDSLFGSRVIDSAGLHALVAEIARLQGELRDTHLQAHLAVTRILARDQILAYDTLGSGGVAPHPDGPEGMKH